MIPTPQEAHIAYYDACAIAEKDYTEYWRQALTAAGLTITASRQLDLELAAYNGYEIAAWVYPRDFDGIKFRIFTAQQQAYGRSHYVKVKSKNGLAKLMHNLNTDYFRS